MSNPKEIAVSSVAAFKDGKLLFGLRGDSNLWTLPGGHADEGESPEKCAVRELMEESGLKPLSLERLGEGRVPSRRGDIRVTVFRAEVEGDPTAENDPDGEIIEFRWVDVSNGLPEEIAANLFSPMNVTLRLLGLQGGALLKNEDPIRADNEKWWDEAVELFRTQGGYSPQAFLARNYPSLYSQHVDDWNKQWQQAEIRTAIASRRYDRLLYAVRSEYLQPSQMREILEQQEHHLHMVPAIVRHRNANESVWNDVAGREYQSQETGEMLGSLVPDFVLKGFVSRSLHAPTQAPVPAYIYEKLFSRDPGNFQANLYNYATLLPQDMIGKMIAEHPGRYSPRLVHSGLTPDWYQKWIPKFIENFQKLRGPDHDAPASLRKLPVYNGDDSAYHGLSEALEKMVSLSGQRRADGNPPRTVPLDLARQIYNSFPANFADQFLERTDLDEKDMWSVLRNPQIPGSDKTRAFSNPSLTKEMLDWGKQQTNISVGDIITRLANNPNEEMRKAHLAPLIMERLQHGEIFFGNMRYLDYDQFKQALDAPIVRKEPDRFVREFIASRPSNEKVPAAVAMDLAARFGMESPNSLDTALHTLGHVMGDDTGAKSTLDTGTVRSLLARTQLDPAQWQSLAQLPNSFWRQAVAGSPGIPVSVYKQLAFDSDSDVQDWLASNVSLLKPEIAHFLADPTTPPSFVARALRNIPRSDLAAKISKEIANRPGQVGDELMDFLMSHQPAAFSDAKINDLINSPTTTPLLYHRMLNTYTFRSRMRYDEYNNLLNRVLADNEQLDSFPGQNKMSKSQLLADILDATNRMDIPGDSVAGWAKPTPAQMDAIIQHTTTPGSDEDDNVTGSLITLLHDNDGRQLDTLFTEPQLHRLAAHPNANMRQIASRKVGPINPDSLHNERVGVRFNTGKLRAVRDLIMASGKESLPAKELPPMEWEVVRRDENGNPVKRMNKKGKEEIVKDALPVRDPSGNISAALVQQYIDSLQPMEFNVSHGNAWPGAQRHSNEKSKVFQINITNNHVNKMRADGSWQAYRNQAEAVHSTGHPVRDDRTTIGWVRYTGSPDEGGIFIDEIQSDFGQSFIRQAVRLAEQRAEREANHREFDSDEERQKFIQEHVREIRQDAESKWPDEHNKNIATTLFNGKHSNEIIHEAFMQYLRDKGHHGMKISIHTPESKGPLSGLQTDEVLPAHFNVTYKDVPKKMGYTPSTYGTLPTQSNDTLKEKNQGEPASKRDKWSPSNATWETVVRKYENVGLDPFYKNDDLAANAEAIFEQDQRRTLRAKFLDADSTEGPFKIACLRGDYPNYTPTATDMAILAERLVPQLSQDSRLSIEGRLNAASILATIGASSKANEEVFEKLLPALDHYEAGVGYYSGMNRRFHDLSHAIVMKGTPVQAGTVVRKLPILASGLQGAILERPDLSPEFIRTVRPLLNGRIPGDSKTFDVRVAARIATNLANRIYRDDAPEYQDLLGEIGRDWLSSDDRGNRSTILALTAQYGKLPLARELMGRDDSGAWLTNYLKRTDLEPSDLMNVLTRPTDSDYIGHNDEEITSHPAFNRDHVNFIFDIDKHPLQTSVFTYAHPNLIDSSRIDSVIEEARRYSASGRDSYAFRLGLRPILRRKLATPEQLGQILELPMVTDPDDSLLTIMSHDERLTPEMIHQMILAKASSGSVISTLHKHPNFSARHLDSFRLAATKPDKDWLNTYIIQSPHLPEEELARYATAAAVNSDIREAMFANPRTYESDKVANAIIDASADGHSIGGQWTRHFGYHYESKDPVSVLSDKTMQRAFNMLGPVTIKPLLKVHKLAPAVADWAIDNAPLDAFNAFDHNTQGSHGATFTPDQQHRLFGRAMDSLSQKSNRDEFMAAKNLMGRILAGRPNPIRLEEPTPQEFNSIFQLPRNDYELVDTFKQAINHPAIPMEKLRELIQAPEPQSDDDYFDIHRTIKNLAMEKIGPEDPDTTHSQRVNVRFGVAKHRKVRDHIIASGNEELRPKEIPGIGPDWKDGRNQKNGNISAKLLDEHIEKQPAVAYNLSEGTYGDEHELSEKPMMDCPECDGKGERHYSGTEECPDCEGRGKVPDKETCPTCKGDGQTEITDEAGDQKTAECPTCQGYGEVGPECYNCEGTGKESSRRTCRVCEGTGHTNRCQYCQGSGEQEVDDTRDCDNCGSDGEVENPDYDPENDSAWEEALRYQQHSLAQSSVLRVNFTTDHVNQMKKAGVWKTFRDMYEVYNNPHHPVTPTTIGWIRYTQSEKNGSPKFTVDEMQSDFGQSFVRQALNQGIEEGINQARNEGLAYNTPEWAAVVKEWAEKARVAAEKRWPEAHHKQISKILFGKRHPSEVLYESFNQWLRDKGHHNADIYVHDVETKAGIGLGNKLGEICGNCKLSSSEHPGHRDFDNDRFNILRPPRGYELHGGKWTPKEGAAEKGEVCPGFKPTGRVARTDAPGHYNVTYHDVPLAGGLEPAAYGKTPDQGNPKLRGKPGYSGKIRKFEEEWWGVSSRNLTIKDLFEDAEWTKST